LPTSLSASKDIFNNIASYKFSEMRFNVRGYDSQYQDVYMNGGQAQRRPHGLYALVAVEWPERRHT